MTAPIKLSIPLSDGDIRAGFQFFTGANQACACSLFPAPLSDVLRHVTASDSSAPSAGGSDTLTMDMLYRFTDILMPTVPRKVLRDALIASGAD